MPCPSFFVVCRQIDIIEFTGPCVWSVSDKRQFVGKRQKNKGRASKVSCSAQKVVGNTWRPWGRFVKNAQFHPTKHLSRWVPELEAERYSTPSIFSAHWHFRNFLFPVAQLPQKWPRERWQSIPMVSCQKEAEISAKIHFRDGVPFWPNIRPVLFFLTAYLRVPVGTLYWSFLR